MKGGFRPNAGRPRGSRNKVKTIDGVKYDLVAEARNAGKTALEHMLSVMNDPNEDAERRDRAAIAAVRYCHPLANIEATERDDDDYTE